MDREGGNRQRMRKSWEWISLSISSFSLHFLILSPFPHSLSISSFPLHFFFIFSFSLQFLFSQPGYMAAASCATLKLFGNYFWTYQRQVGDGWGQLLVQVGRTQELRETEHLYQTFCNGVVWNGRVPSFIISICLFWQTFDRVQSASFL